MQYSIYHDLLSLIYPVYIADVELVRGSHHGQLRLPDQGLVNSGCTSPGRICSDMGGIRPKRHVSNN